MTRVHVSQRLGQVARWPNFNGTRKSFYFIVNHIFNEKNKFIKIWNSCYF
jgi:hypothetical protein